MTHWRRSVGAILNPCADNNIADKAGADSIRFILQ
jgi:hypothetical protein